MMMGDESIEDDITVEDVFDENCDPNNPQSLRMNKILDAAKFLKGKVVYTPCKPSLCLRDKKYDIYYKLENLQRSGSCKDRGILFALEQMKLQEKKLGIVVASLGNAAVAASLYCARQRIRITAVMPTTCPLYTKEKCCQLGAKIISYGENLQEAQSYAMCFAKKYGLVFLNARDHPNILMGYASIGLEILEQMPAVEAILIPVGTGGLAAGIATVIKKLKPRCLIYGIEAELMAVFQKSMARSERVDVNMVPTMADDIGNTSVGVNSFHILRNLIDKLVTVNERCIARGIVHMMETERLVIEGAAAAPLAAVIGNYIPELKFKRVVCLISGGNVDQLYFFRCIQRGLSADARLLKFKVYINNNSQAVTQFFDLLQRNNFNVLYHTQKSDLAHSEEDYLEISMVCQTRNIQDALKLKRTVDVNCSFTEFEIEPFNNKRACPCFVKKKMPR